jgi:hypothetical protein
VPRIDTGIAHKDGGHGIIGTGIANAPMEAFKKALEWGDRIPIGIIYKNHRPILEERIPVIKDKPLVKQSFDLSKIEKTLKEFF